MQSSRFDVGTLTAPPMELVLYTAFEHTFRKSCVVPGAVYTVQLLDGQSTSRVYCGLIVVLVDMMIVGVGVDMEMFGAEVDVTGPVAAEEDVTSLELLLLLRVPPTPPPTAAAMITAARIAATIQNVLGDMPHIVLRFLCPCSFIDGGWAELVIANLSDPKSTLLG